MDWLDGFDNSFRINWKIGYNLHEFARGSSNLDGHPHEDGWGYIHRDRAPISQSNFVLKRSLRGGRGLKAQNESANPITINEDNVHIYCPPLNIRRAAPAGISGTDAVVVFVVYAENKTVNIHLNDLKIVITRGEWTEKLIVLFDVIGGNNRINLHLNSSFRMDVVDQGVRCNFLANHYYNTNDLYQIATNADIRNEHGRSFLALAGFLHEYNASNQIHYYIDGTERNRAEVNRLMSLSYS